MFKRGNKLILKLVMNIIGYWPVATGLRHLIKRSGDTIVLTLYVE